MPEDIKALNDKWKWFVIELDNASFIIDQRNNRGDHRSDAEVKDFSIFKKHYYKKASEFGVVG
jgi:topoisomerase IA-like protein